MRTLIAALAAVVLVAASACSSDDQMTPAYAAQTATIGGCRDLTDLAVQPLSAPAPVRLTGTMRIGPQRDQAPVRGVDVYSPRDRLAGTTTAHPTALGDPGAFTGKGYLLLGLQIDGLATQYRDIAEKRGGPAMVLPYASRDAVQVRFSLCTQGEINAALLYPTVSLVGTHAGLWTHR